MFKVDDYYGIKTYVRGNCELTVFFLKLTSAPWKEMNVRKYAIMPKNVLLFIVFLKQLQKFILSDALAVHS